MGTNEILKFASTNTGTNLLTQDEYSADAQRTTGHQSGVARSKLANKAMRQVSAVASGVAQFIADNQSSNVTDSLTAQNIADYLYTAIISAIPAATNSIAGKTVMASAGEAQQYQIDSKVISPLTMKNAMQGGNQSLTTTGFQKFPGGLIWQWGKLIGISYAQQTYRVTFPVTFPVALLNASVSLASSGYTDDAPSALIINPTTVTHMDVGVDYYASVPPVGDLFWFALGY